MREVSKVIAGFPVRRVPGFIWFFKRTSAPAWKWQDAHATVPSLETCKSQNRALPRAIAAARFFTNAVSVDGSGTGTPFNDCNCRVSTRTLIVAVAVSPKVSVAFAENV